MEMKNIGLYHVHYNDGKQVNVEVTSNQELANDEQKWMVREFLEKLTEKMYYDSKRADPLFMAEIGVKEKGLLECFDTMIFVEPIENEYDHRRIDRWFKVTNVFGYWTIGWRNSVIEIHWPSTLGLATKIFKDYSNTHMGHLVHAYGVTEAREFINRIINFKEQE